MAHNGGYVTQLRSASKLSSFTVVFLRQSATVNLDEKCNIDIKKAILLQRRYEVMMDDCILDV